MAARILPSNLKTKFIRKLVTQHFLHCGSLYFYQILLLPFAIVKIAELE